MVATCVFVLLASIILQPIHRAYAEELAPDTTLPEPRNVASEVAESAAETSPEAASEPDPESIDTVIEPEAVAADSVSTTEVPIDSLAEESPTVDTNPVPNTTPRATTTGDTTTSSVPVAPEVGTATSSPESITPTVTAAATTSATTTATTDAGTGAAVAPDTSTTTSTTTPLDTAPTSTTTPSQPSTTTVAQATSTTTTPPDTATSTPAVSPPASEPGTPSDVPMATPEPVPSTDASTASTTSEVEAIATSTETRPVQVTHTTEANAHQFAKDDCVLAGNGAYYCNRSESIEQFTETSVFAAPDAGGDTEIFVRVAGEEVQITNDVFDDGSPHYDDISERVVWHSLRGDRYQIVSYDFTTERERLLTDTSYNNMEPVAFGERIAWQAWRGGDWEIMLFDGETTIQLTSNDRNDVAPSLYGDYVMWQAQFADGARLAVYDINTGSTEFIKGSEDIVAAQNPRMVLLYDQVDADGTTATFGFDMESGETMPLGRVPAPLPDRLPSPEEPGSEKALVHAQPTAREADERDAAIAGGESDADEISPAGTSTTPTVVLAEHDLLVLDVGSSTTTLTDEATSTDYISDVVVPAASTTSATSSSGQSVEHIPDVVVPPAGHGATTSSTTINYEN